MDERSCNAAEGHSTTCSGHPVSVLWLADDVACACRARWNLQKKLFASRRGRPMMGGRRLAYSAGQCSGMLDVLGFATRDPWDPQREDCVVSKYRPLIRADWVEELHIISGRLHRGVIMTGGHAIGYRQYQSILGGRRMGLRVPGTSSVAIGQTWRLLT